jgi:hypothetical protein
MKEGNVWELYLYSLSPICVSCTDFAVFIAYASIIYISCLWEKQLFILSWVVCSIFCYVTLLHKASAYELVVQESLSKSPRSATPADEVLFSYDVPRKTRNMLELNSDSRYNASCCSRTFVWLVDTLTWCYTIYKGCSYKFRILFSCDILQNTEKCRALHHTACT